MVFLFQKNKFSLRPYHPERARSRLISEAKQGRAWLVLGWEKNKFKYLIKFITLKIIPRFCFILRQALSKLFQYSLYYFYISIFECLHFWYVWNLFYVFFFLDGYLIVPTTQCIKGHIYHLLKSHIYWNLFLYILFFSTDLFICIPSTILL